MNNYVHSDNLPGATVGVGVPDEERFGKIVLLVKGDGVLTSVSKNGNKINMM